MQLGVTVPENMTPWKTSGFVNIINLGNAQQIRLSTKLLKDMLVVVKALEALGHNEIILTAETNAPIIIGGKTVGYALAPRVKDEDVEKVEG